MIGPNQDGPADWFVKDFGRGPEAPWTADEPGAASDQRNDPGQKTRARGRRARTSRLEARPLPGRPRSGPRKKTPGALFGSGAAVSVQNLATSPEHVCNQPREPPDHESLVLIRKAQGGDQAAYEQLFERYYPRVERLVRKQLSPGLRGQLESGDVIHEALIQAIGSYEHLEVPSRPALIAWFASIVRNRLRDLHKRTTAECRHPGHQAIVDHLSAACSSGKLHFEAFDDSPLPEDQVVLEEDLERLRKAVGELKPEQQRLLAMRQEQNLGWQEIAKRLGFASADATRMAFSRAKIELARRLRGNP